MTRPQRIAAAVMSVGDFQTLTSAEIAAALGDVVERPHVRAWRRDDLVERFGEQIVATATHKLGAFFATYLVDGTLDMSVPARRARFAPGGDLRALVGAETADLLLGCGVIESSPWQDAGNVDEPPTAEECETSLSGLVNQSLNRQRLADNYNAAVELIDSDPATTWEQVAALLTE